jgi:diaminopimelate decarboxylase
VTRRAPSSAAPRESWPDALALDARGRLSLDGVALAELAAERGTPLWVVSRSTVEGNFGRLLEAFSARWANCEIAYSIKAHNTLAVIRLLHARGAKVDASAEFECQLALAAGVPAGDIILNGNGKSEAALEAAARLGIRQVNVDSLDELRRLDAVAGRLGRRVNVLVRVQLTYDELLAEDPSFESTLRVGEGKFGNNVRSGQALETIEAAVAAPNLDFLGLSHHVGFSGYMADYSPGRELGHHRAAVRELVRFANEARRRLGPRAELRRLDLGGGFRTGRAIVLSTPGAGKDVGFHAVPTAAEYAEAVFGTLEAELEAGAQPLVQFETGGWQIANAVVLLARVSEVKDVGTSPPHRFVVIDASAMMFVARETMRVGYPVLVVDRPLAEPVEIPVDVVGQTCVYDSVAEEIRLPETARGDLLALLHQGAYCETESTQFNGFPRPEVVLADAGRTLCIKRRETLDDIRARDTIPEALRASQGGSQG